MDPKVYQLNVAAKQVSPYIYDVSLGEVKDAIKDGKRVEYASKDWDGKEAWYTYDNYQEWKEDFVDLNDIFMSGAKHRIHKDEVSFYTWAFLYKPEGIHKKQIGIAYFTTPEGYKQFTHHIGFENWITSNPQLVGFLNKKQIYVPAT